MVVLEEILLKHVFLSSWLIFILDCLPVILPCFELLLERKCGNGTCGHVFCKLCVYTIYEM